MDQTSQPQEIAWIPAGPEPAEATGPARVNGVLIGILTGFRNPATPLVLFPGNRRGEAVAARTTCMLTTEHTGRQVALLFEDGDTSRPLVIGLIQNAEIPAPAETESPVSVSLDGEQLVLSAEREIILRCGKASITLTRAGKILLRGAYLLSRSSGVNRIKGGSVQIN